MQGNSRYLESLRWVSKYIFKLRLWSIEIYALITWMTQNICTSILIVAVLIFYV